MKWTLFLNGAELSSGDLVPGDGTTSTNLFMFEDGSGGVDALSFEVVTGDVVNLQLEKTFTFADFVGVDLTITTTVTPDLAVDLTPINPPIIIPPQGGSFRYLVAITNNTATEQTVDLWIEIEDPQGGIFSPGPSMVTIGANATTTLSRRQRVPSGLSAGVYTLRGLIGTFPIADASDSFTWEKTAAGVENELLQRLGTSVLYPNYPDPFNPATTIRYALPEAGAVRLVVYNALGQEVAHLVEGLVAAGTHEVVFDGQGLPSGVYLYRLEAGTFVQTRRMTLVK
jgi:hypothetical protein